MGSSPLGLSIAHEHVSTQAAFLGVPKGENRPLVLHASIVSPPPPTLAQQDALNRRFILQGNARTLLPDYRVAKCLRVPSGSLVEIIHHPEYMRASYGGLQTCGSVHVCAVCGAKVSERRAAHVCAGVASWGNRGGSVVLATFTLQHNQGDGLADLGAALNQAYRKLRGGKAWQSFEKRFGLAGSITAREYTHGAHGWHPHLHSLWFVQKAPEAREARKLERWVQSAWKAALERLGAFADLRHGARLDISNQGVADYVVKSGRAWTVGDELAKANMKRGRVKGSRSVVQLLADAGTGDERAGRLFQEYAAWTYRKNALVWSPGLRQLLGLDEQDQTDEELAAEQIAGGRLLVALDRGQWWVVVANDARAEVLMVAAAGEAEKVCSFLEKLGVYVTPAMLEGEAHETTAR